MRYGNEAEWPDRLPYTLDGFRSRMWELGREHYRDLPWRHTTDPYAIWVSEVMLQQTQVSRVDGRWQAWLERFPTVLALAQADQAEVLSEWQGMGYNRRALALKRAAQAISKMPEFPREQSELVALPGIGPATASGIRAFAFNLPGVYLETNVRTVFIHELFPDKEGVSDAEISGLVACACPVDNARSWYYGLLDYGSYLKRSVTNPSRRSLSHVRQSRFEGSHRQRRAEVVRILLEARPAALETEQIRCALDSVEVQAGRTPVTDEELHLLMRELSREGFCSAREGEWVI